MFSDRARHYEQLTNNFPPIEAAAAARTLGEEALAAKYLARHRSKFEPDAPVDPQRAEDQKKYIQWALGRNVSHADIVICAQAMGEGSFTEKALKQEPHTRTMRSDTKKQLQVQKVIQKRTRSKKM